ncbi:MAG: RNA polymerase sigma factor [Pseudonocardiaceae bacterium]
MANAPFSDADLIARVLVGGDRNAFGELVRRHQSAVRAHLRKLTHGNAALADDLSQETFIQAYRNLRNFRGDAKFSTWLYRIAYNSFVSDARRIRESPLPEHQLVDDEPAEMRDQPDLRLDLARAMLVLNDAERAAIVQCYHNDLTHEEAAYVLGIPLGTVKTNVLKAKEKLRSQLQAWQPGQGKAR